jgi:hypothetical protein
MGRISTNDQGHLESIVYFLGEALRAAIQVADRLQQSACNMPKLGPNMDCMEIADKLAAFRQHTQTLWNDEVMMLTKILRARDLAKELRFHEPELRPEIDTFRLATVYADDLRGTLLPDTQNMFNGAVPPKRFLEARGYTNLDASGPAEPLLGYKVAGATDIRLLLDACETLHFGLASRYGFDWLSASAAALPPGPEAPVLLDDEPEDEEPFLLTEFSEIVSDGTLPLPLDWQAPQPAGQARAH